jgi:hypothetical protein
MDGLAGCQVSIYGGCGIDIPQDCALPAYYQPTNGN